MKVILEKTSNIGVYGILTAILCNQARHSLMGVVAFILVVGQWGKMEIPK